MVKQIYFAVVVVNTLLNKLQNQYIMMERNFTAKNVVDNSR